MIAVKRALVPAEDVAMDEIGAFETESYYGFYCSTVDNFVLIPKNDSSFDINIVPEDISPDDLNALDDWVRREFCEGIIGLHKSSKYKIELINK